MSEWKKGSYIGPASLERVRSLVATQPMSIPAVTRATGLDYYVVQAGFRKLGCVVVGEEPRPTGRTGRMASVYALPGTGGR